MKRIKNIIPMVLIVVLLSSCIQNNTSIVFNSIDGFNTSGQRLVEPVVVDRDTFTSAFSIDLSTIKEPLHYTLNYGINTDLSDKNNVVDGFFVTEDEKSEKKYHAYISKIEYVPEYGFSSENSEKSIISNHSVELFHLKDGNKKIVSYVKTEIMGKYITISFTGYTEHEIITFVESFIKTNFN